jgi:ribosomal protein L9
MNRFNLTVSALLTLALLGCGTSVPKTPAELEREAAQEKQRQEEKLDNLTYEEAIEQVEKVKVGLSKREIDALFGTCTKSVANNMNGLVSFAEVSRATNICVIKLAN